MMPFGRYRGKDLARVPSDYLIWLSKLDVREPLRGYVGDELRNRQDQSQSQESSVSIRARLDRLFAARRQVLADRTAGVIDGVELIRRLNILRHREDLVLRAARTRASA